MPGPAATLTSMHVCPMVTGYVPHVGGPVTGPGVPTVLIGGKPAAVMGDMCTCVGPPDTIVQGEATVLIGGKPAATMGSMTAHGGSITVGEPTVLIGTGAGAATAISPVSKIPFPKINTLQKFKASVVGKAGDLKEAVANQEALKKEAEEQEPKPVILKAEFFKEETNEVLSETDMVRVLKMRVFTKNISNGDSVTINLRRIKIKNKEGKRQEDEEVITLSGTVNDDVAIVEYEVPDYTNKNE